MEAWLRLASDKKVTGGLCREIYSKKETKKVKKAIRAFSLILAAVFVIIAVASCTTSDPSHTGENSGADVTSGEPKVEKYGNVPLSDKSKFEGKEFLIATYLGAVLTLGYYLSGRWKNKGVVKTEPDAAEAEAAE